MKRIFDIVFSLTALGVFAIPMLSIFIVIKLSARHPFIFRQARVGIEGRAFQILKIQTMINGNITSFGRLLRRAGLDELPQFVNVLKGDMSIVGPRALTQEDIERLGWNDCFHKRRWSIKPGITGFAQLYGGQHRKTSWFWDSKYIKSNNILLDFIVVALSFMMNLFGKKTVRRLIWPEKSLL